MNEEEAEAFESHPDFEALLSMRKWDDSAKIQEIPIVDNDYYKELCRKVLCEAWTRETPTIWTKNEITEIRKHFLIIIFQNKEKF